MVLYTKLHFTVFAWIAYCKFSQCLQVGVLISKEVHGSETTQYMI